MCNTTAAAFRRSSALALESLDLINTVYMGLLLKIAQRLQLVQNAAASFLLKGDELL